MAAMVTRTEYLWAQFHLAGMGGVWPDHIGTVASEMNRHSYPRFRFTGLGEGHGGRGGGVWTRDEFMVNQPPSHI